ncbi:MAG: hypothetical protein LBS50_03555 [Prevotellaceae bacterium]|jgi:beta-glucosidase-like glycosyl hydrolase|nr:hypothetical protein [Prevotellaceae bacterium]
MTVFEQKLNDLKAERDELQTKLNAQNDKYLTDLKDFEKNKNELEILRQKVVNLKNENAILQNNYQILKTAKAFGQSEQDKKNAYRRLTRMITEIDNCLELLNE